MEKHKGPCVSIFMPMHRLGKETQQDPIRVKTNPLGTAANAPLHFSPGNKKDQWLRSGCLGLM
jgi:hypothetical protein